MKVGTKLIAINPYVLNDGIQALTVGKEYVVKRLSIYCFWIINDREEYHLFYHIDIDKYFQSINEDSILELGFRRDVWADEGKWHYSRRVNIGEVLKINIDSRFNVFFGCVNEYEFLPNCKTLTDLKHLIRILGI